MFKYLIDVRDLVFTVAFIHQDGSVQLANGQMVHMDDLRSDRVWMMPECPSFHFIMDIKKRDGMLPGGSSLNSLVRSDVPLQKIR